MPISSTLNVGCGGDGGSKRDLLNTGIPQDRNQVAPLLTAQTGKRFTMNP